MIGYKDKTWCSETTCQNQECPRYFGLKEHEEALRWWGNEKYPIIVSNFLKQGCKDYVSCDRYDDLL